MRLSRQQGFGLIEVLVAFVVIAAGAAALVKLQGAFLTTTAESGAREAAMHLAETKLDDLRTFEVVSTTTGKVAYQDIANNLGGNILAGTQTIGNQSYSLSWSVSNQFLSSPPATIPERKDVTVLVSWTDRAGSSRQLSLSGKIAAQLSVGSTLMTGDFGLSQPGPQVTYTPGSAPDVVSISLNNSDTLNIETSKPVPNVVKKGSSTEVQFDTITYDAANNRLIQSDLTTVSCSCSLGSGTQSGSKPAEMVSLSQGIFWQAGATATKAFGAPADNQQSALCDVCCANHFDGPGTAFADFYDQNNKVSGAGHAHYASSTGSAVTSGDYLEACRMMRIDGYYELLPDWNLIALNVMSADYLSTSANVVAYQTYVKQMVKTYVEEQPSTTNLMSYYDWLGTANISGVTQADFTAAHQFAPGVKQLIARAVYVDFLANPSSIDTDTDGWLSKVSFNEINVTLLANWSSSDSTHVAVTNEAIQSIINPASGYYGTYSRGVMTGDTKTASSATATITASLTKHNSGLTGSNAISAYDAITSPATLTVQVDDSISDAGQVIIKGTIQCLNPVFTTTGTGQSRTTTVTDSTPCSNVDGKIATVQVNGSACDVTTVSTGNGSNAIDTPVWACSVARNVDANIQFSVKTGAGATSSSYNINPTGLSILQSSYPAEADVMDSGECVYYVNTQIPSTVVNYTSGCNVAVPSS